MGYGIVKRSNYTCVVLQAHASLEAYRSRSKMKMFRPLSVAFLVVFAGSLAHGQFAPVFQTGQTKCYDDDGEKTKCKGTGQDGEYQYGLELPKHRFEDNRDGTVTDTLT